MGFAGRRRGVREDEIGEAGHVLVFAVCVQNAARDGVERQRPAARLAFAGFGGAQEFAPLQSAAKGCGITPETIGDFSKAVAKHKESAGAFGVVKGEAGGGGFVCHVAQYAPGRTSGGLARLVFA